MNTETAIVETTAITGDVMETADGPLRRAILAHLSKGDDRTLVAVCAELIGRPIAWSDPHHVALRRAAVEHVMSIHRSRLSGGNASSDLAVDATRRRLRELALG